MRFKSVFVYILCILVSIYLTFCSYRGLHEVNSVLKTAVLACNGAIFAVKIIKSDLKLNRAVKVEIPVGFYIYIYIYL